MLSVKLVDPRFKIRSPQLSVFAPIADVVAVLAALDISGLVTARVSDSAALDREIATFCSDRGLPVYRAVSGDSVLLVQDNWKGKASAGEYLRIIRNHTAVSMSVLRADPQLELLTVSRPGDAELIDFFELAGSLPVEVANPELFPVPDNHDNTSAVSHHVRSALQEAVNVSKAGRTDPQDQSLVPSDEEELNEDV